MTNTNGLSEQQVQFLKALYASRDRKVKPMARNFEIEKHELQPGARIKAWTMIGRSVHGGMFYGWLEGVITQRDLRNGKHLYYEIDGKRWIPSRDVTDAN